MNNNDNKTTIQTLCAIIGALAVFGSLFVWSINSIVEPLRVTADNTTAMVQDLKTQEEKLADKVNDHESRIVCVETKVGVK